ncbi:MAG: hypothetical protein AAF311_09935 [Pseudomonadota bacterium]
MKRIVLASVAALFLVTSIAMFLAPSTVFHTLPGATMTGPFNRHFVMDVGIVFFVCGLAIVWGMRKRDATALMFAFAWPCLHALLHLYMWVMRSFALDLPAAANFGLIQLPAWLGLWAAIGSVKAWRAG